MTSEELVLGLEAATAQVAKIGVESGVTLAKVAELEAALAAAGNITPEVATAFEALKAQVQVVDDLIPG
jgi:phosphoribosylformimino-5-aminoimidazole carboxamide ribonucleotide (ProFAR) isomerase